MGRVQKQEPRVPLRAMVLTALACRCHKLLSRACAGCPVRMPPAWEAYRAIPKDAQTQFRNTRTGAFCFSCHALSMPDFGATSRDRVLLKRIDSRHALPDDQRVDVVGALVGLHRLEIRHVAEDGILVGHAVRAQNV